MDTQQKDSQKSIEAPLTGAPDHFKKKPLLMWLVAGFVALALVGGVTAFLLITRGSQNQDAPQTASDLPLPNVADANGLITSQQLECVPRGHDYYRTNKTLHVDPKNPDNVFVGVEYKGVFATADGGDTWTHTDKGIKGYAREADSTQKCVQELGRMIVDPTDSVHFLLSRVESPSTLQTIFGETAGLYESKDAGMSWKHIITNDMNASGSQAIAFDPKDPKVIYYGINNGKPSFTQPGKQFDMLFNTVGILYKTTNGGQSWEELPTGAEEGFRAMGISVDPTNSNNIWLGTFAQQAQSSEVEKKALIKSTDGGKTWQAYGEKLPAGSRIPANVVFSPTRFKHVYVSTQSTSGPQKDFYTTDGETFTQSNHGMFAAGYDPHDTTSVRLLGYTAFDGPGIYQSLDGGATWTMYAPLPAEVNNENIRVSQFVWSMTDKDTVYMSGSGAMVWKSKDNGKTWKTVLNLEKLGGENKNKDGSTKSREPDQ